ncbi:hypothetical protein [Rubrivirga marina]|uniref:DUF4249 family protein n=1 Tax=Rubrivirga marina TaxID=1196024 RepID=A0A271IYE7_9BACT|nr:hypothetical protein [Rubrivirga marina]PAP76107.1 hypothetical protein BSZ37_06435 [Rubrivirga marina]
MRRLTVLLALAVLVPACDSTFEPRVEDAEAFAIFGTLDGRAATQRLRVQDLASSVFETPDRLPAEITSTEITSGRTTTWRDSLVTLSSGDPAHLFLAGLTVAPGETHRIEAVRTTDGARSSVTIAFPTPTVAARPQDTVSTAVQVDVAGLGGARLLEPVVRYRVRRPADPDGPSFTATAVLQATDGGAVFTAFLATAEIRAGSILYGTEDGDAVLTDARLEGVMASAAPVPVTNGAGGVAWAVPISIPIPFAPESITRVGFIDGR